MGRSIFRARHTGDTWGGAMVAHNDDVVAWLDLPPDFRAPDDDSGAYRTSHCLPLALVDEPADDARWAEYMSQD